ncbi:MAG: aconitate hydratase, partial [Limisphaerales bacterium]
STDIELDLASVGPSVAGPKRPQDRIALNDLKQSFAATFARPVNQGGFGKDEAALSGDPITVLQDDQSISLQHGSVLIAAITSCTNTSNPGVMLAAGLVAKKAVERGLTVNPAVKASLAPGSRVVSDYLSKTGLQTYLDQLGFNLVGYGCTTCIGNSGPLSRPIEDAVVGHDLVAASVLSGNRNFEARVHQNIKANFLMSPPLVVALALAGRVDIDLAREPIGMDSTDQPVFLKDLWPSLEEIRVLFSQAMDPAVFQKLYSDFADQNPKWNDITSSTGNVYQWDEQSTYIQEPPFFSDFSMEAGSIQSIEGARALGVFGDSVTTDHISPAGAIKPDAPAGKFLESNQVAVSDFNSYGSRRGNDRIMTRGTFANVRIKNLMVPGVEGGVTCHQPSGEQLSIYDAAQRYAEASTPLVVLAGHEYGTGSSRDWAAKGTRLLGVKAVVAASFERIHRSNLVGMGVLPLQFEEGETIQSHQLDGSETYDLLGLSDSLKPRQKVVMKVTRSSGQTLEISLRCRIDTDIEIEYYRHGGILPYVLRQLTAGH